MINFQQLSETLKNRQRDILGHEQATQSAVLIPLLKKAGEWHVLFEVRAEHLNRQPGEICFPGGRVDETDRNDKETAIRETCEELQLPKKHIQLIGPLDILVSSEYFFVYPHVGVINEQANISPNPGEVDEVFTVPLSWLKQNDPLLYYLELEVKRDQEFPFHLIPNGKDYDWRKHRKPEYFYLYHDRVIWGLTARILKHFLTFSNKHQLL
jgi:8-oxo-dGTP pyrophosphatase MutT (NUDIX family)